jgi:hypothetical protein
MLRHRILMKATSLFLVALIVVTTAGCYTQTQNVGAGGSSGQGKEFRQWFALWGLVPITDVQPDVEAEIAGATDFTIETSHTPLDVLIGIFTGIVTIGPRTVTVTK